MRKKSVHHFLYSAHDQICTLQKNPQVYQRLTSGSTSVNGDEGQEKETGAEEPATSEPE